MAITEFLSLEKPAKEDRINVDVLNDNTDKIDKHFERTSIVLSVTDNNISVDATGPYYTVTNNNADTVQALLEGNSMLLDPGETFKMNKDATETFTLEVTCASDVTVAYFMCNKEYIDGSIASNLTNYYDKTDSDSRFLKIEDFGAAVNEESSSVCSEVLPLKYTAYGNNIEQYRIYGDTSQATGAISPAFPKTVYGTGDLITDSGSEHYGEYALPIVCNGTTYNVYLDEPLYETNSVRDYIDYARQKVIRKTGVITLDGSSDENWTSIEYQTYGIDVGVQVVDTTDNNFIDFMFCDKLSSSSSVSIFVDKIAIIGGKIAVHFDSSLTSVELFTEYLQENPITVYFPLAETVEEDVVLPDLPTIYGENQLYVDTTVTPKNVVVGAAMQYFSPREMYESFPSKDEFWTKSESEKYTTAEKNKLAAITNPIKLKGRVDSISYLPADAEIGWLYFVGTESTVDKEEYVYTEEGTWEHIGTAEVDLSNYYTKSEVNTALSNKADSTTLTTHTGNADIHVTAEDKTAWNLMPKSKAEMYTPDTHKYQDFVIPILNIASTYSNEWFYGQIFLKKNNGAGYLTTIINLMCYKGYNEEKAVYYMDKSQMYTEIKPCSFTYNSKKMFGIHVNIVVSDYNILRVDARSTTDFDIITPVYIYNNNTSAVLNAEIYNSLSFFDGYSIPMNFYEIPKVIKSNGTATKLLSFSPVPASATATGIKGDIAYDSGYMYVCTDTNTWKRTQLSSW